MDFRLVHDRHYMPSRAMYSSHLRQGDAIYRDVAPHLKVTIYLQDQQRVILERRTLLCLWVRLDQPCLQKRSFLQEPHLVLAPSNTILADLFN